MITEAEVLKMVAGDTKRVLRGEYNRSAIEMKMDWWESPIFDALAADRFASDVTTFNLGDYR